MLKRIKDKKGFTLVEVIVVLIILAILAALLVPQLTGYIDKANDSAIKAEARAAVMACNTLYAEYYAGIPGALPIAKDVAALAEVPEVNITLTPNTDSTAFDSFTYTDNGKQITYTYTGTNKGWGEVDPVPEEEEEE